MKKIIISVFVAFGLFLSAFLTSSAMAGGFGVGIIGAGANFTTTGSETEGTGDQETNYAPDQDANVLYGSIFAEYTFGEMYGLTLGASYTPGNVSLGAKSRSDTETATNLADTGQANNDAGRYSAEAKVSNHATIYIEPTIMPTENWGVYLKGGVARVTVNSLESIALGASSSAYGDETINGLMYGVGMKGGFDSGMFYKLEVIRILYERVKMTSTTGNKNTIHADPEQLAARLAIGYRF